MGFDQFLKYSSNIDDEYIEWKNDFHIHNYFEKVCGPIEVDGSGFYDVKKEDIIRLKELCDEVVANPERAKELLPIEMPYFPPGLYDEFYFSSLKQTSRKLGEVLDLGYDQFTYHAWW